MIILKKKVQEAEDNLQLVITELEKDFHRALKNAIQKDLESAGFKVIEFKSADYGNLDLFYADLQVQYMGRTFKVNISHSGRSLFATAVGVSSGSTSARGLAQKLNKIFKTPL